MSEKPRGGRAISYARFSSARQIGGTSIERQIRDARDWCRKHDVVLDESFVDRGYSAYRGDHTARGNLGRLVEAIEKGDVPRGTYLIVEALDRLDRRDEKTALSQFLRIISAGIKIVTLFDDHVYTDTSETIALDLIVAIIYLSESHKSSLGKSVRQRKTWDLKRSANTVLTTVRPAWLDVNPQYDPKRPDPNIPPFIANAGAKIIRRIFDETAAGVGSYSIAKRLNDEHVPPLTGDKKHNKDHPQAGQSIGNGWNRGRVNAILRSDAPLGWFQPHVRDPKNSTVRIPEGPEIKGYYPIIIDPGLAARARVEVTRNTFHGKGSGRKGELISNLFSGVAKCAQCGNSMFLAARTRRSGKPGRLRCGVAIRNKQVCDSPASIPYGKLEEAIIRDFHLVRDVVMLDATDNSARELQSSIADKRGESLKLEAAIRNMTAAFADDLPRDGSLIARQMRKIDERHQTLLSEIESLERQVLLTKDRSRDIGDLDGAEFMQELQSVEKEVRRLARSRLASLIRRLFNDGLVCQRDGSIKIWQLTCTNGGMLSLTFRYDADCNGGVYLSRGDKLGHRLMSFDDFAQVARIQQDGRYRVIKFNATAARFQKTASEVRDLQFVFDRTKCTWNVGIEQNGKFFPLP